MRKNRLYGPLVFVIFANMTILGFINSMRGVSYPLIRNSFGASYDDMGLMNALASFSAVCFCIVSGLFMNRFGLKKTMIAAFVLLTAGALSFYFASAFWMTVVFVLILQSGVGFFEISLNGSGVRFFTAKSALMMNLLHFFYGVGAIGGPRFMGFMVNRANLGWQEVYPLALAPAFVMLAVTLAVRFPANGEAGGAVSGAANRAASGRPAPGGPSFWSLLKDPIVWLFGVTLGFSGAIEGCCVSWSGLHLLDVYGLDPSVAGAAFVSVFYVLYTVSRFLSGFVIEKTGYMRSVIVSCFVIIVIFAVGFGLGRRGVYLLPVAGFFVAVMYPTILAISVGVFGERAQIASSVMISVAFTLGGVAQYAVGLANRFIGAAWGFRACLLYSVILAALLLVLRRRAVGPRGTPRPR
jgi:fucose permease